MKELHPYNMFQLFQPDHLNFHGCRTIILWSCCWWMLLYQAASSFGAMGNRPRSSSSWSLQKSPSASSASSANAGVRRLGESQRAIERGMILKQLWGYGYLTQSTTWRNTTRAAKCPWDFSRLDAAFGGTWQIWLALPFFERKNNKKTWSYHVIQ